MNLGLGAVCNQGCEKAAEERHVTQRKGDAEPDLVRCFSPPPELSAELWLIVREDLKAEPHVRAFTDFLASYVRETCASAAPTAGAAT